MQSLHDRDLGHLQIIADTWGIEFSAPDARIGLQRLIPKLLDARLLNDVIHDLPEVAREAYFDLIRNQGCLPWALITRRYGALREMGQARRDRELPHRKPISATEALWYRGLIGRSFFDTPHGPEEFAFIPADLLALAPEVEMGPPKTLGQIATPTEHATLIPASDRILDHACTYLAALRVGLPLEDALADVMNDWRVGMVSLDSYKNFLRELLVSAGLLDSSGVPKPEPTRTFLEQDRGESLSTLSRAWLNSTSINELHLVPGIIVEGEWQNVSLRTRHEILDLIAAAPGQHILLNDRQLEPVLPESIPLERVFVNLISFIQAVHQRHPDFQRPAGDYDSWFIRNSSTGEFLRGFEHWDQIDGRLLDFMICGPLFWLGIVDLVGSAVSSSDKSTKVIAFRFSAYAQKLLNGETPAGLAKEEERWQVKSDGQIDVPRLSSRAARYQIARFCAWDRSDANLYRYHLTAVSLERAREQGLRVSHLLRLLRRQATTLPPKLIHALERWEDQGSEVHFEKAIILRVKDPEILQELRSGRAARFLGDPLGPAAIIVKSGAVETLWDALLEMGYLSKVMFDR
jgi:hypothetical protein